MACIKCCLIFCFCEPWFLNEFNEKKIILPNLCFFICVNLFSSTDQKKSFANSVDPDKTALMSRLIRIYAVCLFLFSFWSPYVCFRFFFFFLFVYAKSLVVVRMMGIFNLINGRVHFRNSGMEELKWRSWSNYAKRSVAWWVPVIFISRTKTTITEPTTATTTDPSSTKLVI